MNKIVVVFQSKYGATRKYAEWIAKELSCDLLDGRTIKAGDLTPYDTIIFGGGIYAGSVNGIKRLTKNFSSLTGRNLVLFTCGLADPSNASSREQIEKSLEKLLSPDMRKKVRRFYFRGAMDYSKLSLMHRGMMTMVCKVLAKKAPNSLADEEKEMLANYGKAVDFTNREAILPLINDIRGF